MAGGVALDTVLAIVGYRVNALVAEIKRRARLAPRAGGASSSCTRRSSRTPSASLQAMAQLAREISTAADARDLICVAAVSGAGATLATLVEPDGQGGFSVTGAAGIPLALERIQAEVQPDASLRAFYSRERVFITDTDSHAGLSPLLIEGSRREVRRVRADPATRQAGRDPLHRLEARANQLDNRTTTVISYLAAEAGAAIERADLVAQLDQLARTDQLTELPNRRSWDAQVWTAAVSAGRRAPRAAFLHRAARSRSLQAATTTATAIRPATPFCARPRITWRAQLRANDVLTRYGGEEFAVLLPACSLPEATRGRRAAPVVDADGHLLGRVWPSTSRARPPSS